MKKVVLVGRQDERLRELDAALGKYFAVRQCTEGGQSAEHAGGRRVPGRRKPMSCAVEAASVWHRDNNPCR